MTSENGKKTSGKKVIAISIFIALTYIGFYYYRDFSSPLSLETQLQKPQDSTSFNLFTNSYFRLRPGINTFRFDRNIRQILLKASPFPDFFTSSVLQPPVVERISDHLFFIRHDHDFFVNGITIVPRLNTPNTLSLKITHKPVLKADAIVFQFLIAFLACLITAALGRLLFNRLVRPENPAGDSLADALPLLLNAAFLIFILYLFFNHDQMAQTIRMLSLRALPLLLGNFLLTLTVLAVFWISSRSPGKILPLILLALLLVFITPRYDPYLCGDASRWIYSVSNKTLHGSDALASFITRVLYSLLSKLKPGIAPLTVLNIQGKAMGILYLAALALLARTFTDFSALARSLFFCLAMALPLTAFLFGLPEYGYHTLPFLVISFVFAHRYLHDCRQSRLVLAAFFLSLGAFFHGSSFFSLPAILALPLLTMRKQTKKKSHFLLASYSAIFLTVLATIVPILVSLKALGYSLNFENINGAATESRFVVFQPVNDIMALRNKIFLEPGYMSERGWVFLVAFPMLFLFLFKKNTLAKWWHEPGTLVLFLYAIGLAAISLLWDFDFGIRDFDLYAAPMTLFNLFLLRLLVLRTSNRSRPKEVIPLLVLFTMTSPFSLLLFSTLQK